MTDFIGNQRAYPEAFLLPEYVGDGEGGNLNADLDDRDAMFDDAARVVVMHQSGSTSLIQRKLKLGYNRAGRIIDQLEAAGIVGPFEGSKARQVLIPDDMALEELLNNLNNRDNRKLLFIFLLLPSLLFSQDRANEILSKVSKKTASYSTIEAHFTNTIFSELAGINETQKGVLYLKGDQYRLELEGQTIISDGENNWIHLIDEEEVQIVEIDEEEENMSPSKMFTIYQEGYKNYFDSETTNYYIINLIPKETGSFIKIVLRINKKEMRIAGFTLYDKNGGKYTYDVQLFEVNQLFEKDFFQFNYNEHPNVDIIDLR